MYVALNVSEQETQCNLVPVTQRSDTGVGLQQPASTIKLTDSCLQCGHHQSMLFAWQLGSTDMIARQYSMLPLRQ